MRSQIGSCTDPWVGEINSSTQSTKLFKVVRLKSHVVSGSSPTRSFRITNHFQTNCKDLAPSFIHSTRLGTIATEQRRATTGDIKQAVSW